jgi:hypothetical protein
LETACAAYEAFTVYSFYRLCLDFVGPRSELAAALERGDILPGKGAPKGRLARALVDGNCCGSDDDDSDSSSNDKSQSSGSAKAEDEERLLEAGAGRSYYASMLAPCCCLRPWRPPAKELPERIATLLAGISPAPCKFQKCPK